MKKKTLPVVMLFGMTSFAQTTNPAPYCTATFDDANAFPVADAVKNVTLGTLTNNSGGQYAAPHYVFYNNLTAPDLQGGTSYPLALAFDVHGGCGYGVWIDYNHNNTFDANEKIAGNAAGEMLDLSDNTLVNTTFTVPANAQTGPTRMRVRIVEDDNYNMEHDFVPAACNAGTTAADVMDWGETEDYMVNITGGNSAGLEEMISAIRWSMDETQLSVTGTEIFEMQLFDFNGKCVRSCQTALMDITGVPTGFYLLKIVTAEGLIVDYKISR